MTDFVCKKCGSTEYEIKDKSNGTGIAHGLYCAKCGFWHKWLGKEELKQYAKKEIKDEIIAKLQADNPRSAKLVLCGGIMTQYKGKVIDELDEWVVGELIRYGNSYYIKQTVEPPDSNCGIGTFEVIPEALEAINE